MSDRYQPPIDQGRVEALWPDIQAALRADADNTQWRRAFRVVDRADWRDVASVASARAALIVWWWYQGGDDGRWPTPQQVAHAMAGAGA